jgi:hypothetical protein
MKEKILQQLQTARGQNTSPSNRTLETLATILSATITEETQIAAAIEQYKPLMQEFTGETSHLIAEALKAKPADPVVPFKLPTNDSEPAWFTAHKEETAKKLAEQELKLQGFEKAKSGEQLVATAKNSFYKKYKISDSEKVLCEKALSIELKLNQHEDEDSLLKGWKSQYEDLRSASGLGGIDPIESNGGGRAKGTPILNDLKTRLQKEGKLPAPTQN